MKKIFTVLALSLYLGACATLVENFTGYSEKNYQAKVAEHKKNAPAGYFFSVVKKAPYDVKAYYYKVIQVLDDDEVLACQAYSRVYSSYESYKLGKCIDEDITHIVFADPKEIYDNDNFWARYFIENEPFIYINAVGTKSKVRSYTIK